MRRPVDFHIIDGYNLVLASGLVRSLGGPGNLERARARLIGWLTAQLSEPLRARTTVVFDALKYTVPEPVETHEGLTIRFAVNHVNADALIAELIRAHAAPKQLVVVTSDREIQQVASRRGARIASSLDWFEGVERGELNLPEHPDRSASEDEDARAQAAADGNLADVLPPEIVAQLSRPPDAPPASRPDASQPPPPFP